MMKKNNRVKHIACVMVMLLIVFWAQTAFAANESEPNNSYTSATSISVNTDNSGNISSGSDYDWYKFKLTQSGYVTLRFNHNMQSASSNYYYEVSLLRIDLASGTQSTLVYSYIRGSAANTSLAAVSLPAGVYYVLVEPYGSYSGWNPAQYSVTVSIPAKPAAVTLKAASAGYNAAKLSWNKIGNASGYEIFRATSKTGKYQNIKTVTNGSTISYTNAGLTTGKTYYYKVRAYVTAGSSRLYGNFSAVQSAKPVPAVPGSVKAARISSAKIKISWGKVAGASGYEVYRALSNTGSYSKITTITRGSTTSYLNKSLIKGKTYYYKIRAYKTVGGKKIFGSYSKVVFATP